MFLRIKKQKQSHDRTKYSFILVENHREDGKVKQKVVKYLTSWVNEYVCHTANKVEEKRDAAISRLSMWLNIYHDLEEVILDADKKIEILEKIANIVSFPTESDLHAWIMSRWRTSALFDHRHKDQVLERIDDVTLRFNEMSSAYQGHKA